MTSIGDDIGLRSYPTTDSRLTHEYTIDGIEQSPHITETDGIVLLPPKTLIPPTDCGWEAWLTLAGCSLIQAPIWGFPLAFGVFEEYYSTHEEEIKGSRSTIAVIGTTATGILYLSSPITFAVLTRWPRLSRWFGPIGLTTIACGLLMSSFATTVKQLVATQGVICALGSGLLYAPTTLYLDDWFVRRKGLAYGIMSAGKSVAGIVLPFVMSVSLERFGSKITLQAWTVAIVVLTTPLLYFLRPRTPMSQLVAVRDIDLGFLRLSSFWMLQIGNVLQSLGYFLPSAYLSSYAVEEIGLSSIIGTLLTAILNATSVPGSIIIGTLNDHCPVSNVILFSTIGSSLAVFLFWGFSSQMGLITIFAITYGFFGGGFSSTWSGIVIELKAESPALDTGLVFGLLAGGRGIGNVISGPLSAVLFTNNDWLRNGKSWGYNTEYGPMIIFTGVTALLGSWGALMLMSAKRGSPRPYQKYP